MDHPLWLSEKEESITCPVCRAKYKAKIVSYPLILQAKKPDKKQLKTMKIIERTKKELKIKNEQTKNDI